MALPHEIQKQIIQKKLKGKEGKQKIEEIKKIQEELPNFTSGPYVQLRKWLAKQIDITKTRSKIKHQDWLGVKKEGHKQYVLVGQPSAGKSSLIKELSGLQTKVAAYAFTTLKPIPGIVNIKGADFQIIDLPGLVKGAAEDIGGGKRFVGIIKQADAVLLMADLTKPISELEIIRQELQKAEITKPTIIIGNKIDLQRTQKRLEELRQKFSEAIVLGISTVTKKGIDELKEEIWKISNLIRVYPLSEKEPVILEKESTVEDFVKAIHTDMLKRFKQARVSGKSAKFPNQQVSLNHKLEDEDKLELKLEK